MAFVAVPYLFSVIKIRQTSDKENSFLLTENLYIG